jgi:hypothetical protein
MTNATLVVLFLAPVLGQMGDEFYQDFRRGPLHPALGQFGPDAARVIQPAPDGLRIVLLAKRPEPGGVGVTPQFRISGDSEITVGYQSLAPATRRQSGGTPNFTAGSRIARIISRRSTRTRNTSFRQPASLETGDTQFVSFLSAPAYTKLCSTRLYSYLLPAGRQAVGTWGAEVFPDVDNCAVYATDREVTRCS